MIEVTVSLDEEIYLSPLLGSDDAVNFTLNQGGNKVGNISVYTINRPTSITFSSDFEISSASPALDTTKLVKVWITYDEIAAKAVYKYEFLTALV
jgi:hypothetical protein